MYPQIIQDILNWGRASNAKEVKDINQTLDVEALRKVLRQMYVDKTGFISGSYAKGYELMIGKERVGVTNQRHSTRFVVYYRSL